MISVLNNNLLTYLHFNTSTTQSLSEGGVSFQSISLTCPKSYRSFRTHSSGVLIPTSFSTSSSPFFLSHPLIYIHGFLYPLNITRPTSKSESSHLICSLLGMFNPHYLGVYNVCLCVCVCIRQYAHKINVMYLAINTQNQCNKDTSVQVECVPPNFHCVLHAPI